MKPLIHALIAVIVVNLLLAVGFVAWLGLSGRIDQARLQALVDLFELTIDEQQRQEDAAQVIAEEARMRTEQARRLEEVADGPKTLRQRLAEEQEADEVALLRLDRLKRETDDLRRQNDLFKQLLAEQKQTLDAERGRFEQYRQEQAALANDEAFQQTVAMYNALKPKQTKQIFQKLLAEGKKDEVIDYLASMQPRKSASVLKEFKAGDEIDQGVELLEGLRHRAAEDMNDGDDQ